MALNKKIDKTRTISNIKSIDTEDNIVLVNAKEDYSIVDEFYFQPDNESIVNKFIKGVERLVRMSGEYKKYIGYLTNTQDLKNDVIMANIDINLAELEFHHYPFTLYDIVDIMLEHHMGEGIKINSINLAEDVIAEHYANRVGLARLTKTNHELVHKGAIYVPLTSVFGDVNEFINIYYDYISEELIDKYNQLVEIQNKKSYDNTKLFK